LSKRLLAGSKRWGLLHTHTKIASKGVKEGDGWVKKGRHRVRWEGEEGRAERGRRRGKGGGGERGRGRVKGGGGESNGGGGGGRGGRGGARREN